MTDFPDLYSIEHTKDRRRSDEYHPLEIIWQGRQWVVTDNGMDTRNGTYSIAVNQLPIESGWTLLDQLGGKGWVDMADFATAFFVACTVHRVRLKKADVAKLLERYGDAFDNSLRANAHYGRDEFGKDREAA